MLTSWSPGASLEGQKLRVATPMITWDYSSLEILLTGLLGSNSTTFFSSVEIGDILSPIIVVMGRKVSRSIRRNSFLICQNNDIMPRSSSSEVVCKKYNELFVIWHTPNMQIDCRSIKLSVAYGRHAWVHRMISSARIIMMIIIDHIMLHVAETRMANVMTYTYRKEKNAREV